MSPNSREWDERGAALLLAIVLVTILGVLASVIALTALTETLVSGRVEQVQALRYAADGALTLALADLSVADWTAALGGAPSTFTDGNPATVRQIPGLDPLQLCCGANTLSAAVLQAANAGRGWGLDTPQWRLYVWGPVSAWLDAGVIQAPFYVAVWIADDPADGDGDPVTDANGTIALYAAAIGPRGGRRAARALIARPTAAGIPPLRGVRIVAWHETQW